MAGGTETRLALRVSPGSRTNVVVGRHGDAWKLRVAAPPESGKANEAVLDLLSAVLELRRADIRLVHGFTSRDKVAAVTGIDAAESERRLTAAQASTRGGKR